LEAYIRTLGDVDSESVLFPSTRTMKKGAKRAPKTAVPTIATLDKDLEEAGIPKHDERGRHIDLHSLRMVYVTHLRLAGATLEVAKRMARHSDASLTEDIYTDFDLLGDEEREAAAALGELRRRAR
jgi:site-specific recombinase XerD